MISEDLVTLPLCNCWFNRMWLLIRLVVYFMTKMVGIGPHVFGCVIYFGDLEEGCRFAKVLSQENNSKL